MKMASKITPDVTLKKIDEFKTNKYRIEIEFFGIDAKNSLAAVRKFAEWNLAVNGSVVTSLSVRKIPKTTVTLRAYEWSVHPSFVKTFDTSPQATLQKALTDQLGLGKRKIRYLPAPPSAIAAKTAKAAPDQRLGKCYDTTGEVPGVEVPCPQTPGSGGGWSC
jgi:hypothetical protein